jgi:hypothetical protein
MSEKVSAKPIARRRAVMGLMLCGLAAAPNIYANPSNNAVLVSPPELPLSAQQGGEAMFLSETNAGRTLLYIEQNDGAQLAILDVTDPARVKSKGTARLDAVGAFDFVSSLGEQTELVRFRQGQGEAILDLHRVPTLNRVPGLEVGSSTIVLGEDSSRVNGPLANTDATESARDYQVLQTGESPPFARLLEVKQVRQETTNPATGTTFLLAEKGLYLIRRPALEQRPDDLYLNSGG